MTDSEYNIVTAHRCHPQVLTQFPGYTIRPLLYCFILVYSSCVYLCVTVLLQGRSRSATAVIAYIMASGGMSFQAALQLVQSRRKIAEPNPAFQERLKEFEKSDILKQLQSELQT